MAHYPLLSDANRTGLHYIPVHTQTFAIYTYTIQFHYNFVTLIHFHLFPTFFSLKVYSECQFEPDSLMPTEETTEQCIL